MLKEYIINEFGINPKVADICFDAEKKVEKYLKNVLSNHGKGNVNIKAYKSSSEFLSRLKTAKDLQSNEENSNFDGEIKQSSDSKEIKLLHSKTGEIENVKLENYLCNVVSAEMPATFEKEASSRQS